ncbi:hypothetical protein GCM10008018_43420 [Paenibacillus marchantiophytorum]|uniref:Uncharacterized protein n=1 Tax=Paenibacillus marchantiophytorum TaxID=1619310 RepID=A0ABQ1EZ15_9BACL|nr:hypothetical protein GCM10008018_43420 [Paenibacillus marchantiophytorum]
MYKNENLQEDMCGLDRLPDINFNCTYQVLGKGGIYAQHVWNVGSMCLNVKLLSKGREG